MAVTVRKKLSDLTVIFNNGVVNRYELFQTQLPTRPGQEPVGYIDGVSWAGNSQIEIQLWDEKGLVVREGLSNVDTWILKRAEERPAEENVVAMPVPLKEAA